MKSNAMFNGGEDIYGNIHTRNTKLIDRFVYYTFRSTHIRDLCVQLIASHHHTQHYEKNYYQYYYIHGPFIICKMSLGCVVVVCRDNVFLENRSTSQTWFTHIL